MNGLPRLAPREFGDVTRWSSLLRRYGLAVAPAWVTGGRLDLLLEEHRRAFASAVPRDTTAARMPDAQTGQGVGEVAYRPGLSSRALRLTTAAADAFPATQSFLRHSTLAAVAAAHLGEDASVNRFAYLTYDVAHDTPVTQLHYDRKHALKAYVCLTPALPEFGAPAFVPGSHDRSRKIREAHLAAGVPQDRLPITHGHHGHTPQSVTGPAGTLVLFDTDCLHQGGTVSAGNTRRVLRGHSHPAPRTRPDAPDSQDRSR
ncbi:phytanoyl-CoA dioxygenase family protein [Streptomyces cadmiisoli]|uniref:phytanoyl-CoA dioxygenase family protein n=1 Tax=Streptomyces cadmiisoli TaxID=2184053 RepID=UPI003D72B6B9